MDPRADCADRALERRLARQRRINALLDRLAEVAVRVDPARLERFLFLDGEEQVEDARERRTEA